jgi:hypothetical protein
MPKKTRATFTKEQRDLYVQQNKYPKREQLTNNADFRGVTGDVQAGKSGLAIRMENRPEYLAKQRGQNAATLDRKTPTTMVPHHRMGVQDQTAFLAGLTSQDAEVRRQTLQEGGLYIGNVAENLESVYDGILSKGGRKEGMASTDHGEIHRLAEQMRERFGIKTNKSDRSLDTFNGRPIKDMPAKAQEGLQIQLGLQDEMIIDEVQKKRSDAFRKKYGHLTYEQRKQIILNEPHKVGNLSTKVKPKASARSALKLSSNRMPVGSGNMDEDLMTISERLRIVPIEPYSMPRHLGGI